MPSCPRSLLLAPLVALAVSLWSSESAAAPAKGPPQATPLDDGGYIYLAPGAGAIAVEGASATQAANSLDFSYEWAIGGGYLLRPRGRAFMVAFGGSFENMIYNLNWNESSHLDAGGAAFRLLPAVRLGGGLDWLYVYGTLQPGLIISTWRADGSGPIGCVQLADAVEYDDDTDFHSGGCDYEATDVGFNLGMGPGFQAVLYKGLFVGSDVSFDLAVFDDVYEPWEQLFTIDFQVTVGVYF